MAGIDANEAAALPIPREIDQLRALAEMRWRLFVRGMRNDNAKISFALWLTGRIFIVCLGLGAGVLCAFFAYIACDGGTPSLSRIFLFVMLGWQGFALLRESQSGVELELLRFPLRLRTYIALWLSAGALEGLTILGTLAFLGLYIGLLLGHANPFRAAAAVLLFLICNLLLSRNVALWMGRLLARRRTRELVLILFSIMGILPRFLARMWSHISEAIHRLPLPPAFFTALHGLPPAVAAHAAFGNNSITVPFLGILLWDAALAAALVIGLLRAFRGEHLQEFAASSEPARLATRTSAHAAPSGRISNPAVVVAQMEWARLRHGGAAMYGTLAPLLYVALFGLRLARTSLGFWTLPIVAAYLGLTLRSYNVFGADGPGVQTFMLLPIPLRDVVRGKNLFAASIYIAQLLIAALLVTFVAHRISGPALLFTAIWAAGHMAVNFTIGNNRSIRAPMRVATDRVAFRGRRGGSSGGGWIALVCIFAASLIGGIIVAAATWFHHPWLAPIAMLPFSAAAILWYRRGLASPILQGDIEAMEPLGLIVARTA